jgi:hypothetical protein
MLTRTIHGVDVQGCILRRDTAWRESVRFLEIQPAKLSRKNAHKLIGASRAFIEVPPLPAYFFTNVAVDGRRESSIARRLNIFREAQYVTAIDFAIGAN